jgi:hypothetical protein
VVQGTSHFEGSWDKVRVPKIRLTYLSPKEKLDDMIRYEFSSKESIVVYRVFNPNCVPCTIQQLAEMLQTFDNSVDLTWWARVSKNGQVWGLYTPKELGLLDKDEE